MDEDTADIDSGLSWNTVTDLCASLCNTIPSLHNTEKHLSGGHLSRSNTPVQHLANSLPDKHAFSQAAALHLRTLSSWLLMILSGWLTARSLPPIMSADTSRCSRSHALFISVKNITASSPRRPPAERWHYSHCCSASSALAAFTSLTAGFYCSAVLYVFSFPSSFVASVTRRKGGFILLLPVCTTKEGGWIIAAAMLK